MPTGRSIRATGCAWITPAMLGDCGGRRTTRGWAGAGNGAENAGGCMVHSGKRKARRRRWPAGERNGRFMGGWCVRRCGCGGMTRGRGDGVGNPGRRRRRNGPGTAGAFVRRCGRMMSAARTRRRFICASGGSSNGWKKGGGERVRAGARWEDGGVSLRFPVVGAGAAGSARRPFFLPPVAGVCRGANLKLTDGNFFVIILPLCGNTPHFCSIHKTEDDFNEKEVARPAALAGG